MQLENFVCIVWYDIVFPPKDVKTDLHLILGCVHAVILLSNSFLFMLLYGEKADYIVRLPWYSNFCSNAYI